MSAFIPIGECCLKGSKLPGEPKGVMQVAGSEGFENLRLDRYYARPREVRDPKACVVLLYDIFGFSIHNSKILADTYAEHLGVEVYVPDYIPHAPPADMLNDIADLYPGEKKRGWLASAWASLGVLKLLPYIKGILYDAQGLVDKAMADIADGGYTSVGAVGFCRGGTMVTYLLSKGDQSPLTAGAVFHPEYKPDWWPLITRPAAFLLADEDTYINGPKVDECKALFNEPPHKFQQFPDTVHGFAARPAFEHPGTMKAFHDANGEAEAFLRRSLGLQLSKL